MKPAKHIFIWCVLCSLLMLTGCTKPIIHKLTEPSETKPSQNPIPGNESMDWEELICGQWFAELDISEYMDGLLSEETGIHFDSGDAQFLISIITEYTPNGAFCAKLEFDEASYEEYMSAIKEYMLDYIYELAWERGYSKEEFDELFRAQTGKSVEEACAQSMESNMAGFLNVASQSTFTGVYSLQDDRLYVGATRSDLDEADYVVVSLDGDIMRWVEKSGDMEENDDISEMLPWTFYRQYQS